MIISDSKLKALIACDKIISKPPRKDFLETGVNRRNDMELTTSDGKEHFFVFMRQNAIVPNNYSIGLIWRCLELNRDIILYRCNGAHGGSLKIKEHFKCHIHKISEEAIQNELYKPCDIEITDEYVTYDQALAYFCRTCGIKDAGKYFTSIISISLFEGVE